MGGRAGQYDTGVTCPSILNGLTYLGLSFLHGRWSQRLQVKSQTGGCDGDEDLPIHDLRPSVFWETVESEYIVT